MAKQEVGVLGTAAVLLHASDIYWHPDWNGARPSKDYGDSKELLGQLAERGWDQTGDGTIEVELMPEAWAERAKTDRQKLWDELETLAKTDSKRLVDLETFKEIYLDANKKLRPIRYMGVTGNRRSTVYFPAMVQRKTKNLPVTVEIPVKIKSFASEADRLDSQIMENMHKALGLREMGTTDMLKSAKRRVELGANATKLQQIYGSGHGQKLMGLINLDASFPNLEIVDRMCLPDTNPRHIRYKNRNAGDITKMANRADSKALAKVNQKLKEDGKDTIREADEDEVAGFLNVRSGGQDKIMERKDIEGLSDKFPNLPMRQAFKAVITRNVDLVIPYHATAPGFNLLDDLVKDNDYPFVEQILQGIATTPKDQRPLLWKRLLEAINPSNNGETTKPTSKKS